MDLNEKRVLGRTGISVGRLGISSSFGAPCEAYEQAFERGCNYFTWGTFIKGRSSEMKKAIININKKGKRDELVLAIWSYAHVSSLMDFFHRRGLKALGTDYADVLILGYHSARPSQRLIDRAIELKERGLVRHIGLSSHHRPLFSEIAGDKQFGLFHIRYNAAHRGAETDTFPAIRGGRNGENGENNRPGVVSFTATSWRQLLKERKMPKGEAPLTAKDCYRFVLSNPDVDVCMVGTKNTEQMTEALGTLEAGPMNDEELARARRIGDFVYGR